MALKIVLAGFVATCCATVGLAQAAPQATSQPTAAAAVADPDKKVCRREQALGSFLAKSVCHSRREWAAIDGVNASNAETALARRRGGMSGRDRD